MCLVMTLRLGFLIRYYNYNDWIIWALGEGISRGVWSKLCSFHLSFNRNHPKLSWLHQIWHDLKWLCVWYYWHWCLRSDLLWVDYSCFGHRNLMCLAKNMSVISLWFQFQEESLTINLGTHPTWLGNVSCFSYILSGGLRLRPEAWGFI